MTLDQKDRKQLIQYRIMQALETVETVDFLIENSKLNTAVNRIYYGIFYSLLALGLKYGFESSKHLQLIGWFNKEFIRSGKIDVKYGRIVREAYDIRRTGDYDAYIEFEQAEVEKYFQDMKDFTFFIKNFIQN
ncbi:MAG: HEPN domain-containing protein [candidate division KSB1 bacterium]|nr:HEPN domain-containing protein [candidate division KSB1 bacterium]